MIETTTVRAAELNGFELSQSSVVRIPLSFFAFFLISGFCSLLYEVIWLRLAMAQFGVTITMTSTVISVFMAGLGVGSWASGKLTHALEVRRHFPRLRAYAFVEFLIGIGSLVVPYELLLGRRLLESVGMSSSLGYYVTAGGWLAAALLPWCVCMGATFPLAMWAIREHNSKDRSHSFSYLYVANVMGALGGSILPLFLIELFGFRNTLRIGGILNLALAVWAFAVSKPLSGALRPHGEARNGAPKPALAMENSRFHLFLLFATGLTSMGMEVVWIRLYTPYVGTEVYAFASILAIYLASTCYGSIWYRLQKLSAWKFSTALWLTLGVVALLPLETANPQLTLPLPAFALVYESRLRVLLGIAPFSVWLGFLTPMLVDRFSGGDPGRAGRAYAVNVSGCILGPLLAGFVLLPTMGERWSLAVLAAVCTIAGGWFACRTSEATTPWVRVRQLAFVASLLIALVLLVEAQPLESASQDKIVLRDSTATVTAYGAGMKKELLINGIGITKLTPITKIMAHLPLALHEQPPERALAICFGMGTTYRSLLSWGIHADAAELVPSVPAVFHYFHPDAPQILRSPLGRIVVDDGRRYLERTRESYDLITIDPPPPSGAAGSSLLYSKEFYTTAKKRLRPGGIVAQWLPEGDPTTRAAVTRALQECFAHVRVFGSIEGWGVHLFASDAEIPARTAPELAQRLPAGANADLVEWGPYSTAEAQFAAVLRNEISPETMTRKAPGVGAMSDDQPANEYHFLRARGMHR
jgi:spermidine synthase